jgi:hypothetical protein
MMKRKSNYKYAKRARRLFCKGTGFRAPVDLVLSGKRTLEEWTAVLAGERDCVEQSRMIKNVAVNKYLD